MPSRRLKPEDQPITRKELLRELAIFARVIDQELEKLRPTPSPEQD